MSEDNKINITGDAGGGRQVSVPVNLPGNSHKSKEKPKEESNRPRVQRVTKSEAKVKKQGFFGKMKESFSGEDAKSVGSYLLYDVFVPALKSMIADAASQGTERLLFGSSSSRSRPRETERGGRHTPYSRLSTSRPTESRRELSYRDRANHNFDSVIIDSRPEAEEVLDRLSQLVEDYGSARVSDLYEMVGITGNFTDDKWGWFTLRDSGVRRVREGYLILLPAPEVIE